MSALAGAQSFSDCRLYTLCEHDLQLTMPCLYLMKQIGILHCRRNWESNHSSTIVCCHFKQALPPGSAFQLAGLWTHVLTATGCGQTAVFQG